MVCAGRKTISPEAGNAKGVDPMVRIDALKQRTQHIVSRGSLLTTQLTATRCGSHAAPQEQLCQKNRARMRQNLPKFRRNLPGTLKTRRKMLPNMAKMCQMR